MMFRRNADRRPVVVTSAPPSLADQQRRKERQYLRIMGFRMACFLLIFVVPGVWKMVVIVGAVVLPGIAVLLANTMDRRRNENVVAEPVSGAPQLSSGLVIEPDGDDGSYHNEGPEPGNHSAHPPGPTSTPETPASAHVGRKPAQGTTSPKAT